MIHQMSIWLYIEVSAIFGLISTKLLEIVRVMPESILNYARISSPDIFSGQYLL